MLYPTFWIAERTATEAQLAPDEAHHALHVLRLGDGTRIGGVDGKGCYVEGILKRVGKDTARLEIEHQVEGWGEPPVETTLALGLPKHRDRLEWAVEKAVELSVTALIPLHTERTERGHFNPQRLTKLLVAALKQCGRSRLPTLHPPLGVAQALASTPGAYHLVGWLGATRLIQTHSGAAAGRHVVYWIGPEGDFTPAEIELLTHQGAHPVLLGGTRLRTETAALYCLSWGKAVQGF